MCCSSPPVLLATFFETQKWRILKLKSRVLLSISLQALPQILNLLNLQLSQLHSLLQPPQIHRQQITHILDLQIPQMLSLRPQVPMTVLIGTLLRRKLRVIQILSGVC